MNWSSFTRLLTPGFVIIVAAGALTDAVFTCVSTYTTTYLTSVRGVELGVASIVFGAASIVGLAATLGGGALGDRLRRRTSYLLVISWHGCFGGADTFRGNAVAGGCDVYGMEGPILRVDAFD